MAENLRHKTATNFLWRFAERIGSEGVQFIVSIVLARILAPEAYGTISLVLVFTSFLQLFVDCGLGSSLVQKKDADDLDFSSVFYFNILWCSIIYLIAYIGAPYVAVFYEDASLTAIIRVLSIVIIISGLKNIQQAYVSKTLQFKKFFGATLGGTIVSAVVGIVMALLGCGVWSLVAQKVVNQAVDTFVLWFTIKWRPKRMFSFSRLKGLVSYGWKLFASSFISHLYSNIRQLIIGKMYSSADLAFYNRGKLFPNLIVANVNSSINSVLFPVMAKEQDQRERVKTMTRRTIKTSTYIMAPLLIGLAAVAPSLVSVVLTDKWLPCIPYLRIFCITYMFYPIHTANLNAMKAMGRSDIYLKLEIIKKIYGLIILFISMWFGVMAMAYSLLLSSVLSQLVNTWPNKKLLNYSYIDQLKDILPNIAAAVFMGACVIGIGYIDLPDVLLLVIQVIVGAIIYIGVSVICKIDSFDYVYQTARPMLQKVLQKVKRS